MVDQASSCPPRMALGRKPLTKPRLRPPPDLIVHRRLDTFDFTAIPSLNKMLVLDLARCDYINARDNIIALGNSGTGKTQVSIAMPGLMPWGRR